MTEIFVGSISIQRTAFERMWFIWFRSFGTCKFSFHIKHIHNTHWSNFILRSLSLWINLVLVRKTNALTHTKYNYCYGWYGVTNENENNEKWKEECRSLASVSPHGVQRAQVSWCAATHYGLPMLHRSIYGISKKHYRFNEIIKIQRIPRPRRRKLTVNLIIITASAATDAFEMRLLFFDFQKNDAAEKIYVFSILSPWRGELFLCIFFFGPAFRATDDRRKWLLAIASIIRFELI